jgi:hypothetical protein
MRNMVYRPPQVTAIKWLCLVSSLVNVLSFVGYVFATSGNDPMYHDPIFLIFFFILALVLAVPVFFFPYWMGLLLIRRKSNIARALLYIYFIAILGDLMTYIQTIGIFSIAYLASIIPVGISLFLYEFNKAEY